MVTITRLFPFEAAHRLLNHKGKCKYLHGHGYRAEVTIQSEKGLNELGMVVDFSVIKEIIGGWIDDNWDHNIILNDQDPLITLYRDAAKLKASEMMHHPCQAIFSGKFPYALSANPTAENMAGELYFRTCNLLPLGLFITNVRIWETEKCHADFRV